MFKKLKIKSNTIKSKTLLNLLEDYLSPQEENAEEERKKLSKNQIQRAEKYLFDPKPTKTLKKKKKRQISKTGTISSKKKSKISTKSKTKKRITKEKSTTKKKKPTQKVNNKKGKRTKIKKPIKKKKISRLEATVHEVSKKIRIEKYQEQVTRVIFLMLSNDKIDSKVVFRGMIQELKEIQKENSLFQLINVFSGIFSILNIFLFCYKDFPNSEIVELLNFIDTSISFIIQHYQDPKNVQELIKRIREADEDQDDEDEYDELEVVCEEMTEIIINLYFGIQFVCGNCLPCFGIKEKAKTLFNRIIEIIKPRMELLETNFFFYDENAEEDEQDQMFCKMEVKYDGTTIVSSKNKEIAIGYFNFIAEIIEEAALFNKNSRSFEEDGYELLEWAIGNLLSVYSTLDLDLINHEENKIHFLRNEKHIFALCHIALKIVNQDQFSTSFISLCILQRLASLDKLILFHINKFFTKKGIDIEKIFLTIEKEYDLREKRERENEIYGNFVHDEEDEARREKQLEQEKAERLMFQRQIFWTLKKDDTKRKLLGSLHNLQEKKECTFSVCKIITVK